MGQRLKFAREQAKLTQTQLATKSGVAQSDISKLERGDMAKSTGLPALARALLCDVDWLETGEGDPDFGRVRRGWPLGDEVTPAVWAELPQEDKIKVRGLAEHFAREHRQWSGKSSHSPDGSGHKRAA